MTLVTTVGAADADSYAALTATDTYFSNRGIATWTGTNTVKENKLRIATTYLDNQYRERWRGIRAAQTQSLAWPRVEGFRGFAGGVINPFLDNDGFEIPADTLPPQLVTACMEIALLALSGVTLEPRLERGGAIKSISKTVGPLSKAVTYVDGAPVVDRFLVVEGLLRGLVTSTPGASSGNVKLVRS